MYSEGSSCQLKLWRLTLRLPEGEKNAFPPGVPERFELVTLHPPSSDPEWLRLSEFHPTSLRLPAALALTLDVVDLKAEPSRGADRKRSCRIERSIS